MKIAAIGCSSAAPQVANAIVQWQRESSGVRKGEWAIIVGETKLPVRVIVVEIDPAKTRIALELKRDGAKIAPWTIDDAPVNARVALNAGQFTDDGPWGWVVHRAREWQGPGVGPLAGALVTDSAGRIQLLDATEIPAARTTKRVVEAVQSYPTLFDARGLPPDALCADGRGIDRGHRDTRLAIGMTGSGRLLVALTRFDGMGSAGARIPLGPTTPEMATVMRALGATRALMLDGGLSAQLLVRDGTKPPQRWPGLRSVPLALVATPVAISTPPARPSPR